MDFSQVAGALANAAGKIRSGLVRAGVDRGIDDAAAQFCESELLEDAAAEHGMRLLAAKTPLDFKVDQTLELGVDYGIAPNEILRRSGLEPADWSFMGESMMLDPSVVTVRIVIGEFNKWLKHATALQWLREHQERRLRGSGAWVREAYLKLRPRYDGMDELAFLDEGASRWEYTWGGAICFPVAWHDRGLMGPYGMNVFESGWRVGKRYAFVQDE